MGYTWLPGLFAILTDVEPQEAMEVLLGHRRWPRRTTGPGGLPLLGIYGRTNAGRTVVVYIRHDHGLDWTIVSARPMTPDEHGEYEQWEAHR